MGLAARQSIAAKLSGYFGENGCLAVSFCQDLVDLRLVLHGPLDGQLGGVVVVLVDLGVVLGFPVDEDAADDDEVVGLVFAE